LRLNIFGDENTCVKVWNPLNQTIINIYENYSKAGNAIGVTPLVVMKRCKDKQRVHAPLLKMDVALRLTKKEKV
jgi:hypothetical protein